MFKKLKIIINHIYLKILTPNKVAKYVGVNFGKDCKFMTKHFGSEPYLIHIGDNFATSSGVIFITHDGAVNVLRNMHDNLKNIDLFSTIEIGNNVFIGLNTIILPGTRIGNNVIVGAGSITKGELKSNSVYAGVPVKYICSIEEYKEKNKRDFDYTKDLNSKQKKSFLLEKYNRKSNIETEIKMRDFV